MLSCRVENKSPDTVSFYKNILDKFQWFLNMYGIDTIDPITIRSFLAYVKDSENRWDNINARANKKVCPYTVVTGDKESEEYAEKVREVLEKR